MSDPNDMLPIIRQFHDADGDAERAKLLLNVPDIILAKYEPVFREACRRARFDIGEDWITQKIDALRAVRDDMGNLPSGKSLALRDCRAALIVAQGAAGVSQ